MHRDAKRFEHCSRSVIDVSGDGEAGAGPDDHALSKAPVIRKETAKMQIRAQVRVAAATKSTFPAGGCRINRHAHSRSQKVAVSVDCSVPAAFDDARKLMAEDERSGDRRTADARMGIGMQVAPANSGRQDLYKRFTGPRR